MGDVDKSFFTSSTLSLIMLVKNRTMNQEQTNESRQKVNSHWLKSKKIRVALLAIFALLLLIFRRIGKNAGEKIGIVSSGVPVTVNTQIEHGVEYSYVIPGTWTLDLDSMRLSGSLERLQSVFESLRIKENFAYEDLKYGAVENDIDVGWSHTNANKRQLTPWNGQLSILKKEFEDVTIGDLTSAPYSIEDIDGSDDNNQLKPGTVIAVRTSEGNYAKMRVDGYLPLIHQRGILQRLEEMVQRSPSNDNQNYHLKCTFVLYSSSQSIVSAETTASDLPKQRRNVQSLSKITEVHLTPKTPNGTYRLSWSPYGKSHKLAQTEDGLETKIYLGPKELSPILARLEKSSSSKNYDVLKVDGNRNGSFDENEILKTNPSTRREKVWSSFETVVDVPVTDPWTGDPIINPYSMSLWYVEDAREEGQEELLRFTREWWLEGATKLDEIDCLILVSEMRMDGIIDENDEWALAPADAPQELYIAKNSQSITEHAWLGDCAYRITEIHPSGRKLTIEPYHPNITREEDLKRRDPYSEDREVSRSGKRVTFLHDLKEAEALARKENKPLFIEFEATWCGPCKTMDQLVYTADVAVKAAQNVISVKVDGDEQPELKKQFRVGGYPTMILLTPQGRELKRISGYRGVKEMVAFLNSGVVKK